MLSRVCFFAALACILVGRLSAVHERMAAGLDRVLRTDRQLEQIAKAFRYIQAPAIQM
jgi:hypothetical protein